MMLRKSMVKRIISVLLTLVLVAGVVSLPSTESKAATTLTGKTSLEIMGMMGKGWNLGNTFDATGGNSGDLYSYETSWGNPVVVKELIDGVAAAGFTTVRIPITWAKHIAKDGNYTIDPEFLNRIKEVVDYCYANDLFVIINVHHEGWLNKSTLDSEYVQIGEKLGAIWSQIAEYFKDYDQHLIFEGMNEPRACDTGYEWTGNQKCYDAVNYLNQIFVNAVRSNGQGYNNERAIAIPGYAAACSATVLRSIEIPTYNGAPVNNLMISVHCYSPYDFCLSDKQDTFSETKPADTSDIRRTIKDMLALFVDNGIAAYIGECGATNSGDNLDARIAYFNFLGAITKENKIPAIVWDNGAGGVSGGECHRYFNRKTGEVVWTEITEAFINGYEKLAAAEDTTLDFEPVKQGKSSVAQTPQDLGFTPNGLKNQAKINHTEGATLGFSLKVDKSIENMTAFYDISRFADKYIKVSGFVMAEKAEVNIGIKASDKNLLWTSAVGSDWQQFTIALAPSKGSYLYFEGTTEDTFYVDDISIEMVDEAAYKSLLEGSVSESSSSEEKEITATEETAKEAVADVMADDDDAQFGYTIEEEKKSSVNVVGILGIILAVIAIGCGIAATVLKKNKK